MRNFEKTHNDSLIRLDAFDNSGFSRGASRLTEVCWFVVSGLLMESWLPGSAWRRVILRIFGADIGKAVVIKPRVRVKFPWRLKVEDYSWIGEQVWIDNLNAVKIGAHCCLSQGAYLCTGSHDWSDRYFALVTAPIEIGCGAWIGAKASIAPGTCIEPGAVVTMGSFAHGRVMSWSINTGIPAKPQKKRNIRIA